MSFRDIHICEVKKFCFNFQLDDKEFDLPPVDKPPTLESILNEVGRREHHVYAVYLDGLTPNQRMCAQSPL